MRWRCSAASFQRSAVLSSRTSRLVHLTILPPQIRRSQGITSPAPSIGTKLPQTPRFNQLRKRYEMRVFAKRPGHEHSVRSWPRRQGLPPVLALGIEGIEFHVEIMLGGFAGVDGAAENFP